MGYNASRARMESQLASAHRALFRAMEAAREDGDLGAELDLEQIMREVGRVAERSLKGKARKQLDGQLRLVP